MKTVEIEIPEEEVFMKDIMTQKELEEYLDISSYTLANWRKRGLRMVKIKGKIFFMADSVKEFMLQNEDCEYQRN